MLCRKLLTLLLLALAMLCQQVNRAAAEPALASVTESDDPLESRNRKTLEFNLFMDDILIAPLAKGYNAITPSAVQLVLSNENDYLSLPVSIVQSVLQLNVEQTLNLTGRFFINSTLGGLGMLDPATEFGLTAANEDFGQTLAVYGVPEGVYWVAPFLGPTSLRDVLARPVDFMTNPWSVVKAYKRNFTIPAGNLVTGLLEARAQNIDTFATLRRESPDIYTTLRGIYRQRRNAAILNDNKGLQGLSDIE